MKPALGHTCCTTPSAMGFWAVLFALFYGSGLLLGTMWPALRPYGDTLILTALAAACFANFGRHRTLHCGLTGPLFGAAAIVALLTEAGLWNVDNAIMWGAVAAGVAIAFLIEWRALGRRSQGSHA